MTIDCLVVGHFDPPFEDFAAGVGDRSASPADHLRLDHDTFQVGGRRQPALDALSELVAEAGTGSGRYHLGEVSHLGALYLTSCLRRAGHHAEFVSALPAQLDRFEALCGLNPRVVAVTTTFYVDPRLATEVVGLVRARAGDALIVVGGPLVDNLAYALDPLSLQYSLRAMGADVFVREAQGEATLVRLVEAVRDGTPLDDVPNCYLRTGHAVRFTGAAREDNDLDHNRIDWDGFTDDELGATAQTRTARSCAFKCSFCDYPVRAGGLALMDPALVDDELARLTARGVRNVVFVDDTFNVPSRRFERICRSMADHDLAWFAYLRCGNITEPEVYDLIARSGCGGVFLGIESADDRILETMRKRAAVARYRDGIARLRGHGIPTFASFITGFPGETEATVDATIAFLDESRPTFFRTEPFWYNPRAPVGQQAEALGLTGHGYRWRHDTMDIAAACAAVERIFAEVHGSTWMPMYMFDFWALPYLRGKGMAVDELVEFLAVGHAQALASSADDGPLRAVAARLRLAPARFARTVA